MSSVVDHIEANPQETQRLIGLGYPELQKLLKNAEQLHHELIVDIYEQVRERPVDYKEKEKYYSRKASKHTFKGQIIILPDARDIVDV